MEIHAPPPPRKRTYHVTRFPFTALFAAPLNLTVTIIDRRGYPETPHSFRTPRGLAGEVSFVLFKTNLNLT